MDRRSALFLVVVFSIALGAILFDRFWNQKESLNSIQIATQQVASGSTSISGWRTYSDKQAGYKVQYPQNSSTELVSSSDDEFEVVGIGLNPQVIAIEVIPKTSNMKRATTVNGLGVIVSDNDLLSRFYCEQAYWKNQMNDNAIDPTYKGATDYINNGCQQDGLHDLQEGGDSVGGKPAVSYTYYGASSETSFVIADLGDEVGLVEWNWKGVRPQGAFLQIWRS